MSNSVYAVILFAHSWLRWVVLAAGAGALVAWIGARGDAPPPRSARTLLRVFVISLDTQVLLRLALYLFLSPLTPVHGPSLAVAMRSPVLRFFAVEHGPMLLFALAAAHVAAVRVRRAQTAVARRRAAITGLVIALAFVVACIPWPGLPYARPLFRLP